MQSIAAAFFAPWHEKMLLQRQRTQMTWVARIFTDTKSVCIRAIRVPSHIKLAVYNGFFIICTHPLLIIFNQKSETNDRHLVFQRA